MIFSSRTVEDALNDVINMNLPNISKDDWRYTVVKYPVALDKEMKYISRNFVVLAKEKIATGDIIVHRANGYFMVGYHVIPEYMVVNYLNDASQDAGRAIRGYSGEHSGKVIQDFNEEIALKLNDKGGLTVEFNNEDDEWVSAAITEYDAINVDDFDRVERMMRMESLLKNQWEMHLIKQK